jgi:hypothetical protein
MKQASIDETCESEASTCVTSPRPTPLLLFSADPYQDIEEFLLHETQHDSNDSVVFRNGPARVDPSLKPSLKISRDVLCIDSPIQNTIFGEATIRQSSQRDDRLKGLGGLLDVSLFNALNLDVPSPSRV